MTRPPRLAGPLLMALFLLLVAATACEPPPLRLAEGYLLRLTSTLLATESTPPLVYLLALPAETSETALRETVLSLSAAGAAPILLDLPPASLAALARRDGAEGLAGAAEAWAGQPVVVGLPALPGGGPFPAGLEEQRLALERPAFSWGGALRAWRNPLLERSSPPRVAVVPSPWATERPQPRVGVQWPEPSGDPFRTLLLDVGGGWLPSLPLAGLLAWGERASLPLRYVEEASFSGLQLGLQRIPTDRRLRACVPWLPQRVATLAAGEWPEALHGRAVVVSAGETAAGLQMAVTLAALIEGRLLTRPVWGSLLELAVLCYLALLLVLLVPRTSGRAGVVLMLAFCAGWIGVALFLLAREGLWLQLVPATLLTVAGLALIRQRQREQALVGELSALSRELGLALQNQGQLDQALERFLHCPSRDRQARELLYNLALDFERRRRFQQALRVYEHLQQGGRFRDVAERLAQLRAAEPAALRGGSGRSESTLVLNGAVSRPTLGRYEIVRELGRGAMGVVFLGRDPKINRDVAIKTLAYSDIDDARLVEVKQRFFREAEAAGRLHHPHIVTIYDVGEEHDLAFLAMEYLQGEPLSVHCSRATLLPLQRALMVVRQVADALAYAHGQGIVHRDIKPENIMLLASGGLKVTDFGIARVMGSSQTRTGTVLGTPSYMSPEQVAGKKVDGRSDLFSLGVVLYELLCGEKPFEEENLTALMYAILQGHATPLAERKVKVPPCARQIVERLLQKSVGKRYQSATALVEALDDCLLELR